MKIISDALKEDGYVEVNVATIFTAQATTGEAIPDETTYVWHMVSAANGVQFESTDNVFSYKFPRYGHYDLSVIGNHSAGVFADQIRIDAESKSKFSHFLSLSPSLYFQPHHYPSISNKHVLDFINRASVSYIPTIRAGGQSAMAILRTQLNSSSPYEGALSYHLIGENNENLTNIVSTETDGSLKVVFMPFVSTSKDVLVTFKVWNHISSFNTQQSVGVVGKLIISTSVTCHNIISYFILYVMFLVQCLVIMELYHLSFQSPSCLPTITHRSGWMILNRPL